MHPATARSRAELGKLITILLPFDLRRYQGVLAELRQSVLSAATDGPLAAKKTIAIPDQPVSDKADRHRGLIDVKTANGQPVLHPAR